MRKKKSAASLIKYTVRQKQKQINKTNNKKQVDTSQIIKSQVNILNAKVHETLIRKTGKVWLVLKGCPENIFSLLLMAAWVRCVKVPLKSVDNVLRIMSSDQSRDVWRENTVPCLVKISIQINKPHTSCFEATQLLN